MATVAEADEAGTWGAIVATGATGATVIGTVSRQLGSSSTVSHQSAAVSRRRSQNGSLLSADSRSGIIGTGSSG